jgi:hypothetical protein
MGRIDIQQIMMIEKLELKIHVSTVQFCEAARVFRRFDCLGDISSHYKEKDGEGTSKTSRRCEETVFPAH